MGALCCCGYGSPQYSGDGAKPLSDAESEERRQKAAEAAEKRSKDFKQGGGGEKIKAKAKALEEAEKKNKELRGPNQLKWQM